MKKRIVFICMVLLSVMLLMAGCGGNGEAGNGEDANQDAGKREPVSLNISAAASLTDALNEIAELYAKDCADELQFNFGGSGALKTQIEEGAPCDLFISAASDQMDALQEKGLIDQDTRENLLKNTLTLVSKTELGDVLPEGMKAEDALAVLASDQVESIALGEPETVPAGKYAKQALENAGLWDSVKDKVIYAKDVKAVLDFVDTGNADCGFVYRTDALMLETGILVTDMEAGSHDPVVYPAALIASGTQKEAAGQFLAYLKGEEAAAVFEKYGFSLD